MSWLLNLCASFYVILFCLRLVTRFSFEHIWCEIAEYFEAITQFFSAISNRFRVWYL